jgi:hypothetical protein
MMIRDRIKKVVRVKAGELRACPWNWREHPEDQREAFRGLLSEIGIAGIQIVRELPDGTFMLIDGHLRQEEYPPNQKVHVAVLDVTEEEAKKLLASYDSVGTMATTNKGKFASLIRDVTTGNKALASLFSKVAEGGLNPDDLELDVEGDGELTPESLPDLQPSHVRMIQLFLSSDNIGAFEKIVKYLGGHYGTKTLTDTVFKVLKRAYRELKNENDKVESRSA